MWQKFLPLVLAAVVTSSTLVTQFRLGDTQGRVHAPAKWRGQKAILLFMQVILPRPEDVQQFR
jgi:hypothetical protein